MDIKGNNQHMKSRPILKIFLMGFFSFIVLTFSFQACQNSINKENGNQAIYQSISSTNPSSPSASEGMSTQSHGNGDSYSGYEENAYHYLEPGYTCKNSAGQDVPAIKERVELAGDHAILVKNECTQEISSNVSLDEIQMELDQSSLIYEGKTYIKYSQKPNLQDESNYWQSYSCSTEINGLDSGLHVVNVVVLTNFFNGKIISVKELSVNTKGIAEQIFSSDFPAKMVSSSNFGKSEKYEGPGVQMNIEEVRSGAQNQISANAYYFASNRWQQINQLDCSKPRMAFLSKVVESVVGTVVNSIESILGPFRKKVESSGAADKKTKSSASSSSRRSAK